MTGISKNFYKFSSLLATVALFLGLMVTGCSEGDNTPAVVDYDADATRVDVVVGLTDAAPAEDEAAEKGFDVPSNVFNMVVALMSQSNVVAEKSFVAEGSEFVGAEFWKEFADDEILMPVTVSNEEFAAAGYAPEDVDAIAVLAYDADGNLLGTLCMDDVALKSPGKNTVDFADDNAPAFVTAAELAETSVFAITTEPELDEEGNVTVAVGDDVAVYGELVIALSEQTSYTEPVDTEDLVLTLAEDTTALTIDGNVITAVEPTDHAVAVFVAYGDFEASLGVIVEGETPVDELNVTADAEQIAVGETAQLTVTYGEEEEDVTAECTFESADEEIATVDEAGVVTGVADGEVEITASYTPEGAEEALTGTITITVGDVVGGLTLSAESEEIEVDGTTQLTAMYGDADVTEDCTFESADEAIATVDETGLVTGVAEGTVEITATYEAEGEEEPATATIEITVGGAGEELAVTAEAEEIEVGGTTTLTAAYGEDDVTADCEFTSGDEEIATVEKAEDGTVTVTGVAAGTVTITASYTPEGAEEAIEGTVEITVTGEPTVEFTASADEEQIDITGTTQITALYGEDDVTADCTFESADEEIATVDETGLVTGVATGEVTITVKYTPDEEGAEELTAEVAITVVDGE